MKTHRIKTVKGVVDWRLCLGCGACAYICPEQKIKLVDIVEEGIRPFTTDQVCGGCSLCLEVCPAWENDHRALLERPGVIPELSHEFGPVLEMWEGHAADSEIRHAGASGGVITALALFVLETKGMHGALHIGSDPEQPLRNRTRLSRSREELLRCTGSRYAPASACDRLDLIESAPAPCLFIGQPSEVTALRKAQKLRPALNAKVGLAISFFCAGSPATQGTIDLIRSHGVNPDDVEEIRYRGLGWPGWFAVRRKGELDFQRLMTYQESWGFVQRYRPYSLHLFPDGCGDDADIACGDPWYRPPVNGEAGSSLILARTELGREMVNAAVKAGYLSLKPALPHQLVESQKNLLQKRRAIWGRILAMRMLGLPVPRLLGFSLFRNWRRLGFKEKAKSILGTLRRVMTRRYFRPAKMILPVPGPGAPRKEREPVLR